MQSEEVNYKKNFCEKYFDKGTWDLDVLTVRKTRWCTTTTSTGRRKSQARLQKTQSTESMTGCAEKSHDTKMKKSRNSTRISRRAEALWLKSRRRISTSSTINGKTKSASVKKSGTNLSHYKMMFSDGKIDGIKYSSGEGSAFSFYYTVSDAENTRRPALWKNKMKF